MNRRLCQVFVVEGQFVDVEERDQAALQDPPRKEMSIKVGAAAIAQV